MTNKIYKDNAFKIVDIAKKAGEIIMGYYNDSIELTKKEDNSPVTIADVEANKYIVAELKKITPDIPVVAEESPREENSRAVASRLFWLVDPLDGTKSFINRSGDFTVNIALIEDNQPVGGVIVVPAKGVSYFTANDNIAYKMIGDAEKVEIKSRVIPDEGIVIVASMSHANVATENYIKTLKNVGDMISAASSLKFCLIAEGIADIYPRFGRTMEWDTAAGQAILTAAGGAVENLNGRAFSYRKKDFENTYFIARGRYDE